MIWVDYSTHLPSDGGLPAPQKYTRGLWERQQFLFEKNIGYRKRGKNWEVELSETDFMEFKLRFDEQVW